MAMIESNIYINVAKHNGKYAKHFCNIELGHNFTYEILEDIFKRFPAEEGWQLDVMDVDCHATTIHRNYER